MSMITGVFFIFDATLLIISWHRWRGNDRMAMGIETESPASMDPGRAMSANMARVNDAKGLRLPGHCLSYRQVLSCAIRRWGC